MTLSFRLSGTTNFGAPPRFLRYSKSSSSIRKSVSSCSRALTLRHYVSKSCSSFMVVRSSSSSSQVTLAMCLDSASGTTWCFPGRCCTVYWNSDSRSAQRVSLALGSFNFKSQHKARWSGTKVNGLPYK
jgi:hypothetical protein